VPAIGGSFSIRTRAQPKCRLRHQSLVPEIAANAQFDHIAVIHGQIELINQWNDGDEEAAIREQLAGPAVHHHKAFDGGGTGSTVDHANAMPTNFSS